MSADKVTPPHHNPSYPIPCRYCMCASTGATGSIRGSTTSNRRDRTPSSPVFFRLTVGRTGHTLPECRRTWNECGLSSNPSRGCCLRQPSKVEPMQAGVYGRTRQTAPCSMNAITSAGSTAAGTKRMDNAFIKIISRCHNVTRSAGQDQG